MTIVVGYAPTREGEAALEAAGREARLRQSRLVVVSTTRGESHVDPTYRATSALPMLASRLRSEGLDVEVREGDGDAADAVIDAAEATDASLVVIGLKRRSAVGKLLLGSTAQKILLQAPCSVLGVRTGPA